MNKLRYLLLLGFLLKNISAFSSHAMGGEITYECLGANQYHVKLILIRDCSGIPMTSSRTIVITNSCGLTSPTLTVNQVGNPDVISSVCYTGLTTCNGGIEFGMERYTYEGTVTLTGACSDWTLGHTLADRNNSITTTVGAGNDSLYIYTQINNTNSICNNSPVFANIAAGIYYLGYATCYTQGVYDPDGDSLAFQMTPPRTGPAAGDTVQYLSGYSSSNPIHSQTALSFDNATGDLCFTPVQTENSVWALVISEYRNGVLIGQVERDIQLRLQPDPVPNNIPTLSGFDGGNSFSQNACPGLPVDFFIAAYDANAQEDLTMNWDHGITNAIWTNNTSTNSNYDTAFFSWTPTLTDVSTTPHCITASVHDSHCPYTASQIRQYCITVLPITDPFCINPGIFESRTDFGVNVFPNPVQNELHIEIRNSSSPAVSCMFYNTLGQPILKRQFSPTEKNTVDVSEWQRGIYMVKIIDRDKISIQWIMLL